MQILDQDLDLGYTPSASGSRSASMKKLKKRDPSPKPAPSETPNTIQPPKLTIDDNLNDLLDEYPSKSRTVKIDPKPKLKTQQSTDSFFEGLGDVPAKPKQSKPTTSIKNVVSSFGMEDLGEQQSNLRKDQTAVSIVETSKDEVPITSSFRMMKPPLSKMNKSLSNTAEGFAGKLTLDLDVSKPPESATRASPKFMVRKDSVERQNIGSTGLMLNDDPDDLFKLPSRPESKTMNKFGPSLTQNLYDNKNSTALDQSYLIKDYQLKTQPEKNGENRNKQDLHQPPTLSMATKGPSIPSYSAQNTAYLQSQGGLVQHDFDAELKRMRQNYQSQIDSLQEALNKQIALSSETRGKVISEANKMVENQRAQLKKLHSQEVEHLKSMLEWQKGRLKATLEAQLQATKQLLEEYKRQAQTQQKVPTGQPAYMEFYEMQLTTQRKLIDDRERILSKRESQLDIREEEFNKMRRLHEENVRKQERRVLQEQSKMKRKVLEERQSLGEEKQAAAFEAAKLELDSSKIRQHLQSKMNEVESQKKSVERERQQLQAISYKVAESYRLKMEEVAAEHDRVKRMEADLINKLRIVELHAKQSSGKDGNSHPQKPTRENNWIEQQRKDPRGTPAQQKFNQIKTKLNKTSNDFFQIDEYVLTPEEYAARRHKH